jgi:hypothetical protein
MNRKYFRFFQFIISITFLLLYSCDKGNDDLNDENGYRITQMITYRNDQLIYSENYTYDYDKISRIDFFSTNISWFDSTVSILQYPDENKINLINYYIIDGKMAEVLKDSLEFQNSLMIRRINFVMKLGTWTPQFKREYEYSNGLLLNEIYYTWISNEWEEGSRFVYEYDGKNPVKAIKYSDFNLQHIESQELADYKGDFLDSVIYSVHQNRELSEMKKYKLQYIDKMVSGIDYYFKNEIWNYNGTVIYKYDDQNNLESVTDTTTWGYPNTIDKYFCEEGISNYKQLLDPGHGIISKWLNLHSINSNSPR